MGDTKELGRATLVGEHQTEMDSHADTCCVGDLAVILSVAVDRKVEISPFLHTLGSVSNIDVCTAALSYDDPNTGNATLLILHQCLHVPGLRHNLLCPMQLRHNGVLVNDCPRHCMTEPDETDHTLILPDGTVIPLKLDGVTSFFLTRTPSQFELEEYPDGKYLELTAAYPEWDPTSDLFEILEGRLTDFDGTLLTGVRRHPRQLASTTTTNRLCDPLSPYRFEGSGSADANDSDSDELVFVDHQLRRLSVARRNVKFTRENALQLAKTWRISLPTAERTLRATTQNSVREYDGRTGNVERRYPTGDRHLRYKQLLHTVYHDTLHSSYKSTRGYKMAQVYATDFGWSRCFPMKIKSEVGKTLDEFFHRVGVPQRLVCDNAKEQIYGEAAKIAREARCPIDTIDKYSPWQNRAEGEIRELKRLVGRWMTRTNAPQKLWDYCLELASVVRSHTALPIYKLQGRTPQAYMTGHTPDISYIGEFGWYEWVYANPQDGKKTSFADGTEVLCRHVGTTPPGRGSTLSYHIIDGNGSQQDRTSLRKLTPQEWDNPDIRRQMKEIDRTIREKLGPSMTNESWTEQNTDKHVREVSATTVFEVDPEAVTPEFEPYEDEEESNQHQDDADIFEDYEAYDGYVTAQVVLPRGERMELATVLRRKRDADGRPVGNYDSNPIMDTSEYEVQFSDGEVLEYSANIIAENLYSQVDEEGHHQVMIEDIIDHKKDSTAVSKADGTFVKNGKTHKKLTTQGWSLCVQWKDGSTSYERLSDLKEAYPVMVADYAVRAGIDTEPAFAWWVPSVIKRRTRIVSAINKRYHKRSHKFGVELPKTVKRALEIDKETGTTYWRDALNLEIKNVGVAFQVIDDDYVIPSQYQKINCHFVYDIKITTLARKARLVAGGHTTDPPATITYASVVSRESVRIALTIAALNDLKVMSADIQNAYLNSPCDEKIWTVLGPEFGPDKAGKRALVVRALYGLKSAGASFRHHLASCMESIGFKSCLADPNVWYRPNVKANGEKFYEYVLIYTDDILAIGLDPRQTISRIDKYCKIKESSIGPPDLYLGAKLRLVSDTSGNLCWTQSASAYIQEAVKNTEQWLDERNMKLPARCDTPMSSSYRPELDTSPVLDDEEANWYQSAIGTLRWIIEIGRMDITCEVSMLASQMAQPRQGHLVAVLRIFAYLKAHHNSRLAFDPTYPSVDHDSFPKTNWERFYGNVKEAIPPNAPEPLGRPVVLRTFVDADHAGDKMTRRSRTGFVQYINSAPINWYSKKQGGIEGASFGSEFMAMKTAVETNRGLRYKLRMMGIPIDGPTFFYGDNMPV